MVNESAVEGGEQCYGRRNTICEVPEAGEMPVCLGTESHVAGLREEEGLRG